MKNMKKDQTTINLKENFSLWSFQFLVLKIRICHRDKVDFQKVE